nr:hypothetical protein [Mycolicibacterium celeriflavum]
MTVDEVSDEWAVGLDRQSLRTRGVQRGFDQQSSEALTLVRRVDLGVDQGYDAGPASVLSEAQYGPADCNLEAPAVRDVRDGWRHRIRFRAQRGRHVLRRGEVSLREVGIGGQISHSEEES